LAEQARALQEHVRQLQTDRDALQSEVFRLADVVQQTAAHRTGPDALDGRELHRLLNEARNTRSIFGAIGLSLGDVATIIQRVEIEMGHERAPGYDPVERLRVLALRMQQESFEGERRDHEQG
ncbi:unnamed protein product, partial [Mycena citricolor]